MQQQCCALRAVVTTVVVLLVVALVAPLALAGQPAPVSEETNMAGRLATIGLYDLGARTSALYSFASSGNAFRQELFWQSAVGTFDATKAKFAAGDLNNDGRPDALALYDLGKGKSALYAFLSDGSAFTQTTAWSGSLAWSRAKVCVADANGAGGDDVYVLYRSSATKSAIYSFISSSRSTEDGSPAPVTMTRATAMKAVPYRWDEAQIAASDVNSDGKDELVSLLASSPSTARLDVSRLS